MSYLIDLVVRLTAGADGWPETFRRRHSEYLLAAARDDGGFAGRQAGSNLYYTSFGLRALALLGVLDGQAAARAADFLRSRLDRELSGIELYSLVSSAVLLEASCGLDVLAERPTATLVAAIDRHRHADGGFAKGPGNPTSSTYHTFLAVLCKQSLGVEPDRCGPIVELIGSRRRDDGGFVEIPQLRASGTNPTAAAVVLLSQLGRLDESVRDGAARFLASMQTQEGGFRANTAIPMADLLSTLTAMAALAELDGLALVDRQAAADYAGSLQRPDGGFRGGAWDDAVDVEYTFYGLSALALLPGAIFPHQ